MRLLALRRGSHGSKIINIINIFNFSPVSRTFFLNIHQGELTFLTFLQFRAFFYKKMLETAEMLKVAPYWLSEGGPMVPKIINIINIFNFSAVSRTFFFNIHQGELTFLTFLQFRAFFYKKMLETAEMLKVVPLRRGSHCKMYEFYVKNSRFCSFEVFLSKRGSKQQKEAFFCLDKKLGLRDSRV